MNRGKWKVDLQSLQVEKDKVLAPIEIIFHFPLLLGILNEIVPFRKLLTKSESILINICTVAPSHNPLFTHKKQKYKRKLLVMKYLHLFSMPHQFFCTVPQLKFLLYIPAIFTTPDHFPFSLPPFPSSIHIIVLLPVWIYSSIQLQTFFISM